MPLKRKWTRPNDNNWKSSFVTSGLTASSKAAFTLDKLNLYSVNAALGKSKCIHIA